MAITWVAKFRWVGPSDMKGTWQDSYEEAETWAQVADVAWYTIEKRTVRED